MTKECRMTNDKTGCAAADFPLLSASGRLRKFFGAPRRLTDSPAHFPLSPLRPERRDWLTLVAAPPGSAARQGPLWASSLAAGVSEGIARSAPGVRGSSLC